MIRMEEATKPYDLCGQVIGAPIAEGVLVNIGAERLEYKKKFHSRRESRSLSDLLESFC